MHGMSDEEVEKIVEKGFRATSMFANLGARRQEVITNTEILFGWKAENRGTHTCYS